MSSLPIFHVETVCSPIHSPYIVDTHFETDFFVLLQGTPGFHPDRGPAIAADAAVWGYKQIRLRKYYFLDKKKLMERIVRSTNITLWQKQRDTGCTGGVCVDGVFAIFGSKMLWVSSFGQSSIYVCREQGERWLVGNLAKKKKTYTIPLGKKRYEFSSNIVKRQILLLW